MITTEINGKKFVIDGKDFLSASEEVTLEDWLHDMRAQDAASKRSRSAETVNSHRKHLREKTHQHSAAGVLAYCLSKDYIRILVVAGFAVTAEPVLHSSSQAIQTVRSVARASRNTRRELPAVIGGIH